MLKQYLSFSYLHESRYLNTLYVWLVSFKFQAQFHKPNQI